MKRYTAYKKDSMKRDDKGRYVRFKDVAELLSQFETYQQYSNTNPSCPCCDAYAHLGGHHADCELGLILKEAGMNQMKVEKKG